jgi:hypothetical protein
MMELKKAQKKPDTNAFYSDDESEHQAEEDHPLVNL